METRGGKKKDPAQSKPVTGGKEKVKEPTKPSTRSAVPVSQYDYDIDVVFPQMKMFQPRNKLPTMASVVGMLRYYTSLQKGMKGSKVSGKVSFREVAKILSAKWYHDSLPCIDYEKLVERLKVLYNVVLTGSRDIRRNDGKSRTSITKYKELVGQKDKLYDIFEDDDIRRWDKQKEWGVQMGKMEKMYLEDMRGDRKMECGGSVDPVWYQAVMKKQREKEKSVENQEVMAAQFLFQPLSKIEELLNDNGEVVSESEKSDDEDDNNILHDTANNTDTFVRNNDDTVANNNDDTVEQENAESAGDTTQKARKIFDKKEENNNDPLPLEYRHVRLSERKVKDVIYKALANLSGEGLSLLESVKAVVEVANVCFGRIWKIPADDDESFDIDTMPHSKNIREMMKMIEAQSMDLLVDKMVDGKEQGRMLTHYTDSSTKKHVGTFNAQGIHIGKDNPYPLPILSVDGESMEDIAMQTDMAFSMLAIVRGVDVTEIYKLVDVHMTDATEHNKGFAKLLAEMYSLEKPAGQLFCSTHTTLGLARAFNKVMRLVEGDMELEKQVQTFMVDLDVDSKNSSVAGQALDMCLKLVAPEYSEKPWNKYKEFMLFLEEKKVKPVLFAYKDARFGCMSRAAAVLIHHWSDLKEFMAANPGINNRLACLVREVMELPYLLPVFVVFACFGVHMVEPFYAKTISKNSTHATLKIFFKGLYDSMAKNVRDDFFDFTKPSYEGVSERMLNGVKESYGTEVLDSVTSMAKEYKVEVLNLVKLMTPELRDVLARQRRDYGIDEEKFPAQYPVELQADNIDDTPTHNMAGERDHGWIDFRLHKSAKLSAVSRQHILQRCKEIRSGSTSSFRSYRQAAKDKRELELFWTETMKERMKSGSDEKRETALIQERKKLSMLEELKEYGGPFTSAEEVDAVLDDTTQDEKKKKKRMKLEIQYARDTSTLLPKVDPLFRIRKTMPNGKQRDKTSTEFGGALKVLLGKKEDRKGLEYSKFKETLEKLVVEV